MLRFGGKVTAKHRPRIPAAVQPSRVLASSLLSPGVTPSTMSKRAASSPGFGIFERLEVDRHRLAGFGVADAAVDAVALVLRMALDVALRGEVRAARPLDLEMDVRRAAGVGDRLDGAEVVLARRSR